MPIIMKDATKTKPKAITWDQALDLYETHLRARRIGKRTLKDYLREVVYLRDHLGSVELSEVTLQDLRDYQCGLMTGESTRSGRPMCAASVARVSTTLGVFFGFLFDEGLLPEDPTRRLERPKVPRYPPGEVLSVKEMTKLLSAPSCTTADGLRDKAIVDLMYATGLRLFEVVALDLQDVDHAEREVIVRAGKGEKGRVIPLGRSAYESLTGYLERGRPDLGTKHRDSTCALFLSRRGRRLCDRALANVLVKLGKESGLTKRVKPHMIRRTFATHLLKNGTNLRVIQALMGHESLDTTALYLKLDRSELRREVLLRHPRERIDA